MFDYLFNNKHTEIILFFILKNEYCYAKQLSDIFNTSVYGFQKTLSKLEKGGLLVSILEGNVRYYQLNPRSPFINEIKNMFEKAYNFLPKELQNNYLLNTRKRPRRQGKPIA
ncbi:MAG: hypothetical protein A2Y40_09400 [Candidatus Margulisbacteria bacterium GWF2_35_9]|nr:MAG: hypothetical protein A2Y40_09400 [Candidatus Margulisbacteria bacterium GWF2_35_9]